MKTILVALTFYPMWNFEIPRLRDDHKKLDFECRKCPNHWITSKNQVSPTTSNYIN